MKILMTLMSLDIGGAETHVMELAKELQGRGHEIIIASNGGAYVPELEQVGVRHVKIPMHRRNFKSMWVSLRLLRRLIREEQPDLVHAHARIPAFLCGILQRSMHFPLITSAHWVFAVTPLLRLMTNWGDRTVAVSKDIRAYLMENYRIPGDQIHVTINGINTRQFSPGPPDPALKQELGLGDGPVVVLVSRLDESRALAAKRLIEIAPDLSKAVPNVELLLVGGGDREAQLRTLAQEINSVCGRTVVHMTGPRTDVAKLLSLATVFVGVSRAALEAMSTGCPTILAGNEGYDGILTPDKLESAQASNLCCRGSEPVTGEGLLRDLTALLSMSDDQLRQLGDFCARVIREQYSVQRMTEDYLAAYDQLLHPQNPIHAVISGYYGYGNLGDDAILLSVGRQLATLQPPVRLTVLSRVPRRTEETYGFRAVGRFSPLGVLKAIRNCDILISGGGSLLQDCTSVRSLSYYLGIIRLAQHLHKPVFLWSNGIGPLQRPKSREDVRKTLERCQAITLRDQDSLHMLQELGLSEKTLTVTEDPAFALPLPPEAKTNYLLEQFGLSPHSPSIGISVRWAAGMERAAGEFARLGDRIVRELGRNVVFFVMQEPDDESIIADIQRRMEERSYVVRTPDRPEDMLGIIHAMDALVSMRLHTIIFAAKARVPVVGCIYDPKVETFLKRLGMPDCGSPKDMTADAAFSALQQLLQDQAAVKQHLEQQVHQIELRAEEALHLFENTVQMYKEHTFPRHMDT